MELTELIEISESPDFEGMKKRLKSYIENIQNVEIQKLAKKAKLPYAKTLKDFRFSLQPQIEQEIMELANCSFIDKAENIILLGDTGLGKTHIAGALGIEALKKKKKVKFITAQDFFAEDKKLEKLLKDLIRADLLILDELGLTRIDEAKAELLYRLISKRHGKKAMIVTTNVLPKNWLANVPTANAILDRVFENLRVLKFQGDSYRIKK